MIDRSQLPPPPEFYGAQLAPARLGRPNRRGWVMTCCPAHKSKSKRSFAVNLETGGFHCFGCDLHGGDVISYVMQVHHCDFKRAKQVLGLKEPATERERQEIAAARKARDLRREREAAAEHKARRERLDAREEVHVLVQVCREAAGELKRDPTNEQWWGVLSTAFEQLREAELEYLRQCGFSEEQL